MNARTILLSLTLFCCLTAGASVIFFYQQTVNSHSNQEREATETTARLVAVKIDTALEDYVKIVKTMTALPDVIQLLNNPAEADQLKVRSKYLLYQFCNKAEASICYLLRPNGDVLLDNRGPHENSLEGKNYAFRPYYLNAMKNGGSTYPALGTLTLERGIYFSHRIDNEEFETLGVGVIKVLMDDIEREMNYLPGTFMLIDPQGVVFSSSRPDWVLKTMWALPAEQLMQLVSSRQYGKEPLQTLGFSSDLSQPLITNQSSGMRYNLGQAELRKLPGWRLVYLKQPGTGALDSYIPVVAGLFLLTALATLFLYRVGVSDLSRRRAAEAELKDSETRLRQLTEITSEGIIIHQQGKILDCNRAVVEIFGIPRDQLIGRDIWALMAPESIGTAVNHMMSGVEKPYDIEGKRADGEIFPMEVCARDSLMHGQGVRVCCFRDMSQAQQLIADRIHRFIDSSKQYATSFAVVYIDLDNFKRFNDSLGHPFGDKLLTAAARRLRTGLNDNDSLIRYGGDEFIVILGEIKDSEQLCSSVDRLHRLIKQEFTIDQRNIHLSATFGVALYPNHGDIPKQLLQNAEIAMYRCREEGLNGYYGFYADNMSIEVEQRLDIEQHLRKALDKQEIYLNYQPVFSYEQGRLKIAGAEVLVRWNSRELGFVPPDKFIPIAESTGLILEIGDWIIRKACIQGAKWLKQGLPAFRLAVNISPRQLRTPTFVEDLQNILDETGFPHTHLCLEITEGILIEDDQYAKIVLNKIKTLGICLSMDDFGTGYSSLSYLKNFPFDLLKIDRTFVMGLEKEHSYEQLVKASLLMANGLSLRVVAEGVETKAQLDFLAKHQCGYYQGFLLSKPLSETDFEQQLQLHQNQPEGIALVA